MPQTELAGARRRTHTRTVTLEGWKREDGLWDLEARLIDVKDFDCTLASGVRPAGAPVHEMRVTVTIDKWMNIVAASASSEAVPYPGGCEAIAPAYERLAGMNLMQGFRRTVAEMFDGARGCSHLTELLLAIPSAAIQTMASEVNDTEGMKPGAKPFQLDRCHALDTTSETVRRYYPRWYRGRPNAAVDGPAVAEPPGEVLEKTG